MNNKQNIIRMKQDYDMQTDSLFFYRTDDYDYKKSVRMDDDVILDLGKYDEPVAFEILHASKLFGLNNKYPLTQQIKLNIGIAINEDTIIMEGNFILNIRQKKEPKLVKAETENLLNLPVQDLRFATA